MPLCQILSQEGSFAIEFRAVIEPSQECGAPHEPVVSLSLCREVESRLLRR